MPGDNNLCGSNTEILCNGLNFGNAQRLLDLVVASKRRVRLQEEVVLFCPLQCYQYSWVKTAVGEGANLEQLRLRVPEVELDLVHGGLILEGVGGQVLNAIIP